MTVWQAATVGAWGLLLLDLALTLRVVRRLRSDEDYFDRTAELLASPDLVPGEPAPSFRARTLQGASVGLEDYVGRDVVFIFVSPECPTCRREIRSLVHLARVVRERADVEMALVSDFGPRSTADWVRRVENEDRIAIDLDVIVAPPVSSTLFPRYNPRVVTPFFCFVDSAGQVAARGPLGAGDWLKLRGAWEGTTARAARRRMAR